MPSVIRGSDGFDTAGGNAVKAWVNFNGTGTPAIRAAYNVASITDNGAGDYTLNFTTALPNANYAVTGSADFIPGVTALSVVTVRTYTTSNITIDTSNSANGAKTDPTFVNVAVFR